MRTCPAFTLSAEQRRQLETWARSRRAPLRLAERARMKQNGDSATARQFAGINGPLSGQATMVEGTDAAPTPAMYGAVRREVEELAARLHASK